MSNERDKFESWIRNQVKEEGLIDFHFSIDPNAQVDDSEEIYKEINAAIESHARGESIPFSDVEYCEKLRKERREI